MELPEYMRLYVTKSKAGHYTATIRCKGHRKSSRGGTIGGALVCRSTLLHGTKESARSEVMEHLAAKLAAAKPGDTNTFGTSERQ